MPDIMAVTSAVFATVKKLKDVSDKIKDADAKNLVADLYNMMADLKIEIAGLKEENLSMQQELAQLKKQKEEAAEMEVVESALFFKAPPAGKARGPYCTNCMQNLNKLVLMQTLKGGTFAHFGNYRCPDCEGHF